MELRSAVCLALALAMPAAAAVDMPEPPNQRAPWTPIQIAGAPDYIPQLVSLLFSAGLADPRGGEYRRIRLNLNPTVETNGWYFPQGFAVCWDGLVYRVTHAGAVANLWHDVTSGVGGAKIADLTAPPRGHLVGVALLLRLNEPELAWHLLTKVPDLQPGRLSFVGSGRDRYALGKRIGSNSPALPGLAVLSAEP